MSTLKLQRIDELARQNLPPPKEKGINLQEGHQIQGMFVNDARLPMVKLVTSFAFYARVSLGDDFFDKTRTFQGFVGQIEGLEFG